MAATEQQQVLGPALQLSDTQRLLWPCHDTTKPCAASSEQWCCPPACNLSCSVGCLVCGCAAYPPLYPNFPATAMDTPLKYHEQELSYAGIDLKKLTDSGKKVRAAHNSTWRSLSMHWQWLHRALCSNSAHLAMEDHAVSVSRRQHSCLCVYSCLVHKQWECDVDCALEC
jgi:hypothetical protein